MRYFITLLLLALSTGRLYASNHQPEVRTEPRVTWVHVVFDKKYLVDVMQMMERAKANDGIVKNFHTEAPRILSRLHWQHRTGRVHRQDKYDVWEQIIHLPDFTDR